MDTVFNQSELTDDSLSVHVLTLSAQGKGQISSDSSLVF